MKLKIKNKKSLKGMTLLEVVIAIAVFAIAATLLVEAGLSIIYNVRSSRNLVKKVNFQSQIVACKPDPTTSTDIVDTGTMNIELSTYGFTDVKPIEVKKYQAITEKDVDGNPIYEDVAGNLKFFTNWVWSDKKEG